jgi:hypothetical protein
MHEKNKEFIESWVQTPLQKRLFERSRHTWQDHNKIVFGDAMYEKFYRHKRKRS